jgi:dTDP-4-amino-4,6-dideoxygalactose transaminase
MAQKYAKGLEGYPVTFQEFTRAQRKHVYHLLALRSDKRDALIDYLSNNGIQTLVHYPTPVYLQKAYRYLGIKKGACVIAEDACKKIFSVPLYPYLKDEEIEIVINKIRRFFNGYL